MVGLRRALPSTQTKPVGFTVHAIVTTSDLELRPSMVDFGHCTVYEAIRTSISLCNHSLLPQEFGFVGLPKVGAGFDQCPPALKTLRSFCHPATPPQPLAFRSLTC